MSDQAESNYGQGYRDSGTDAKLKAAEEARAKADTDAEAKAKADREKAEADAKAKAKPLDAVVGENVAMKLAWLDKDGKPMLVVPKPDAPPLWSEVPDADKPALGALTVAPDGLSATDAIIGPGAEAVRVEVLIGGVPFLAMRNLTVPEKKEEPKVPEQVLGSVEIVVAGEEDTSNLSEWNKPTPRRKPEAKKAS